MKIIRANGLIFVPSAFLLLTLFLSLSPSLFPTDNGSAATEQNAAMELEVALPTLSITTDKDVVNMSVMPSNLGSISSEVLKATVTTNSTGGYKLFMDTAALNGGTNGNLTHETSTSSVMTPIHNGTPGNPATIGDPKVFTASNCNAWGFAVPSTEANVPASPVVVVNNWNEVYSIFANLQTTNAGNIYRFAAVQPAGSTLQPIKSSTKFGRNEADDTNILFAACGGGSSGMPRSGRYSGTVILSAIANAPLNPPIIVSISPNTGDVGGGDTVTITGANFQSEDGNSLVASVAIGGNVCTALSVVSNTKLTCVTPAGTAGAKDVTITSIYGEESTAVMAFTYERLLAMQQFMPSDCAAMDMNSIRMLVDARDNRRYKIKKMPDNKCWMYDNLGYTGNTAAEMTAGGHTAGQYGDMVENGTTGPGVLIETTSGSNWDTSNSTRNFVNNSTAAVTVVSGTRCTTTETGTGTMQSICGNQILYNFCAANGLDSSTIPTCAAVSTFATGAGMTSAGIIGAPSASGGKGGESRGSGGSSICPAGWRLPSGNVGTSNTPNNEWAILQGSMLAGTLAAPNYTNNATNASYWEPEGTDSAFGTVSAGNFVPGQGLYNQSTFAYWWTSSLNSSINGARTHVFSGNVFPGTANDNKNSGFAVRCVLP